MSHRSIFFIAVCIITACTTTERQGRGGPVAGAHGDASRRWAPGPRAEAALSAVWEARPFEAPASALALASKGALPLMHQTETLLFEEHETIDASGRSTVVTHSVFRYLTDGPDRTLTFSWAPWRQDPPRVQARVVSPDGDESWLDPSTLLVGAPSVDGIALNDVKALAVPLPNARMGSVVELQLVRVSHHALLEGAGALRSYGLWSFSPIRKLRIGAEVPADSPLVVEATGVAAPKIERDGSMQRFTLEVPELDFKPMGLTRSQIQTATPRLTWSTGRSWEDVAKRYRALVADSLDDRVSFPGLDALAAGTSTPKQKAQAVLRWVSEHLRYTALHLGDGAIVPTRPSKVLERGWGDCKDLAVVTTLALRSLGLTADVAAVAADGSLPSDRAAGLEAFNHMIVAVRDGPGILWLDPTAPKYPAGLLPLDDRDQRALILSADTKGLTPTPRRVDTPLQFKQTFELELAAYQYGRATVTLVAEGAADAILRQTVQSCDEATARKLAAGAMESVFGDVPFTARLENCAVGAGPLTVVAKLDKAERLETLDLSAEVGLFSRLPDVVIPDAMRGDAPSEDQRTNEVKADQQQRLKDELGLSEEQLKSRAFTLDSRPRVERVYRIKAPPRFAPRALPPDRTVQLGPATFTETYKSLDPSTVEVRFVFESPAVEYTPKDVERYREAFWKRWGEPMPQLAFLYEPMKLLEERKLDEASALMRRWAQESPKDGPTRARTAALLLRLGLGELARAEAERAVRDAPNEAIALMVRGNVARCDDRGRLYGAPFERAKAIEYFEKALKTAPDHNWLTRSLADLLRRNDQGEVVKTVNPEVAKAAQLLEQLSERKQAGKEALDMLVEIYIGTGQIEPLRALLQKRPDLAESDTSGAIDALQGGVDAALKRIARIEDPKQKLQRLLMSYGAFAAVKRYDEARTLLERFEGGPAVASELQMMRAYSVGIGPAPEAVDVSTPEAAARSVFGIIANSVSDSDAAKRLQAIASGPGKAELDGTSHMFAFARLPSLDVSTLWDQMFHKAQCMSTGSKTLVRVRCQVAENRKLSVTTYWVSEGGKLKLESMGKPSQLASRAWALAKDKKSADAAQWIDWLVDELNARENTYLPAALLKDHWAQGGSRSGDGLTFAAALTWFVYSDIIEQAPPAAVDALAKGRFKLSGALKRRADELLSDVYAVRGNHAAAAKVLEPLAIAENEPRLWRRLASLESEAGKGAKAMGRAKLALKRDPQSFEWREMKGLIELRQGRYSEALGTLKKLSTEKGDAVDIRNNLAWAQLMAGRLDEDAEREVLQMTAEKTASENALHTGAMVLLERGRVLDAVALDSRRRRANSDEKNEASWLFRGRLLSALGYDEASKAALAKVTDDPELKDLKKRTVTKVARR